MKNKERGITLVALVITIIILLILAGITINSLTGNGLFEKTKLAKERYENAEKLENQTLEEYKNEIDEYINNDRETTSKNMTETLLYPATEEGEAAGAVNVTYNLKDKFKNYKYLLVEAEATGSAAHSGTTTIWVPTKNIILADSFLRNGTSHSSWSMWVAHGYICWYFNSETSFVIGEQQGSSGITHIYGIN